MNRGRPGRGAPAGEPYSLLRVPQAWRNAAALKTLFVTYVLAATMLALVAAQPPVVVALTAVAAGLLVLVGGSAAGMQFMAQAAGQPVGGSWDALLGCSPVLARTLGFLGLLAAGGLVYAATASLLLLAARLPGVGPVLYLFLLPLLAIGAAAGLLAALLALCVVAPALWHGLTLRHALQRLQAILAAGPLEASLQLALPLLFAAAAAVLIVPLAAVGVALVLGLAALVLPAAPLPGSDFVGPGIVGAGLVAGVAAALVVALLDFGVCLTYLKLDRETSCIRPPRTMESALARPVVAQRMSGVPAATAAARRVRAPAAPACPECRHGVAAEDAFCSHCGHPLG